MKKHGSQLSLFNDKQVRRSFLCRFSVNPRKELIQQLRMENLFGIKHVICTEGYAGISHFSADHHFKNRHSPYVKEGRRYFYN